MLKINIDENESLSLSHMCEALAELAKKFIAERGCFNLAISGGGTAKKIFAVLTEKSNDFDWRNIRFFWVDERCVPMSSQDSNYGEAERAFFAAYTGDKSGVFRLRGEDCPVTECRRYSRLISVCVKDRDGEIPSFDCIILGMGADGHVASIFPQSMYLLTDPKLYSVSVNPQTRLWRMTMTGPLILAAKNIFLPVYGEGKVHALRKSLNKDGDCDDSTPAAYIIKRAKNLTIYTDINA